MVDAALCWDNRHAIRRARKFEPFNLTWLEEPLHPDNLRATPKLSSQSPMRIAPARKYATLKEMQQLYGCRRMSGAGGFRVVGGWPAQADGWDAAERHRCGQHSYKTASTSRLAAFVAALPNSHYFEYASSRALRQPTQAEVPVIDGDIAVESRA